MKEFEFKEGYRPVLINGKSSFQQTVVLKREDLSTREKFNLLCEIKKEQKQILQDLQNNFNTLKEIYLITKYGRDKLAETFDAIVITEQNIDWVNEELDCIKAYADFVNILNKASNIS